MERKALVLRGPFTTADIAALAGTLRAIDHQNPSGLFEMYMIDPDSAELEAKRMFAEILPPQDDRETSAPEVLAYSDIGRLSMVEFAARLFLDDQSLVNLTLLEVALNSR